jgi:hypothetical protein
LTVKTFVEIYSDAKYIVKLDIIFWPITLISAIGSLLYTPSYIVDEYKGVRAFFGAMLAIAALPVIIAFILVDFQRVSS